MRLTICDALLNLLVNNRVEGPSALTIRLPGTGRLARKISARMRALCRFFPSDTIQATILPGHCSLSRLQAESPSPPLSLTHRFSGVPSDATNPPSSPVEEEAEERRSHSFPANVSHFPLRLAPH